MPDTPEPPQNPLGALLTLVVYYGCRGGPDALVTRGVTVGRKQKHPDEEWALGVWQWSRECEETHNCIVQVSIYCTPRRGVLMVQLRAVEVVDRKPAGIRAQVKGEYPTAQASNFLAFIGTLYATLDATLTDYAALAGL